MSLLKLVLIGNLGRDAIVKQINNSYVIDFPVAYSARDRAGNNITVWVNCSWWHDTEPKVAEYLKKGKQVYIEGTPSTRAYQTNDGILKASLSCRVTTLRLLGSTKSEDFTQPQQSPATQPQQPPPEEETQNINPELNTQDTDDTDDLPF